MSHNTGPMLSRIGGVVCSLGLETSTREPGSVCMGAEHHVSGGFIGDIIAPRCANLVAAFVG
jgi:hypothetical protein